ncbi:hydrogenase [Parvibaculum sp.]|uniref:hydrogenase n=1 Tax=Parvibaculum sp. TaxID=2024848 RepID=UPI001DBBEDE8|nr:hydrogenase [Parvibaculum sp.]MBX3487909.1 hydrogenase [Parvibaculum sp.]MCW5728097.1 hydrogenase [Parvibaculum sp.]
MTFSSSTQDRQAHWLVLLGLLLFLIGLLTGFVSGGLANSRMGLSAHLEGLMNGIFLALLGLLWSRLVLGATALLVAFWLVVYAAFANWLGVLLAAIWGAGAGMMPLAAQGMSGSGPQEAIIAFLLISLSVAMVLGVILVILGLWHARK